MTQRQEQLVEGRNQAIVALVEAVQLVAGEAVQNRQPRPAVVSFQ